MFLFLKDHCARRFLRETWEKFGESFFLREVLLHRAIGKMDVKIYMLNNDFPSKHKILGEK